MQPVLIERSFDPKLAKQFAEIVPRNAGVDWAEWLKDTRNVMALKGENVGMATFEYPGVYNVHWFFTARGKEALQLAKEMLDYFFQNYDVKTIRGLTPVSIKGARWLARQIGLKSYGILEYPDDEPYELFCMTKEEFYNGRC